MQHYTYSNINEMIKCVEEDLTHGQSIVDGWQENKYYVLVISTNHNKPYADTRLKLKMPV